LANCDDIQQNVRQLYTKSPVYCSAALDLLWSVVCQRFCTLAKHDRNSVWHCKDWPGSKISSMEPSVGVLLVRKVSRR